MCYFSSPADYLNIDRSDVYCIINGRHDLTRMRSGFLESYVLISDTIWCCSNSFAISTTSINQRRLFCLSKWSWRSYVYMFQWTWTSSMVQSIDTWTVQWHDRCSLESKFILFSFFSISFLQWIHHWVDHSKWRYSIVMVRFTTDVGHVLTEYCYLFYNLWTIEMFDGLSTNECQSMDTGYCRRFSENMCSNCY